MSPPMMSMWLSRASTLLSSPIETPIVADMIRSCSYMTTTCLCSRLVGCWRLLFVVVLLRSSSSLVLLAASLCWVVVFEGRCAIYCYCFGMMMYCLSRLREKYTDKITMSFLYLLKACFYTHKKITNIKPKT